jgi:hypothetical protein
MVRKMTGARRWRVALVAGVVMVLASACVIDLAGELGEHAVPWAINDQGVMAGSGPEGAPTHNARFEPGGVRVDLPDPPWVPTRVIDINNSREVLGESFIMDYSHPETDRDWPVVWRENGEIVDLRPLIPHAGEQGVHVYARGINDNGLVVGGVSGWDRSLVPPVKVDTTFIVNVRPVPAAVTIPADMAAKHLWPYDFNNNGDIVGFDDDLSARWVHQGGTWVRQDLGNFDVHGINNRGDLVGQAHDYPVYGPAVWYANDRTPTVLSLDGLPEGQNASQGVIGDSGVVVFNGSDRDGRQRPVRWKPGGKAEIFPLDGWTRAEIYGINNAGVAVGFGERAADGTHRGVRWTFD